MEGQTNCHPEKYFLTHAYENITLPQTSFAGGKNASGAKRNCRDYYW